MVLWENWLQFYLQSMFAFTFWMYFDMKWLDHGWRNPGILNSCQNPLLNLRTCTSLLGPMKLDVKDFSHHIVVTIWPRRWKTCQPHGAVWRVKILTSLWFHTWYLSQDSWNCQLPPSYFRDVRQCQFVSEHVWEIQTYSPNMIQYEKLSLNLSLEVNRIPYINHHETQISK